MAPPPVIKKKHKKPLTSLQRKQIKKKRELIHKAQVKSQYYKTKDPKDDAPDYVKEIFAAERTIDKDGNVVELATDSFEPEQEEISLDDPSDNDDTAKTRAPLKPNPFKSQLEDRERLRKETEEEKKERLRLLEAKKKETKAYYRKRRDQRGKMLARTKTGQLNMAAQMDVLLEKIQKSTTSD
ncbi:MAG: hypothetical protein EXX96DRAFT_568634 [Benjaminiella poitrasii]|nr:MAG: hypothetical protein EXX96DRAFT_568634 [Benjaminiella poitrasii]